MSPILGRKDDEKQEKLEQWRRVMQGGALVDQHATEGELAERVIPVRIACINEHLPALHALLDDLTARWTASGRMADATLRPDEK